MLELPDRNALEDAARIVRQVLAPTPQYAWPGLAVALGTTVWLKHENHTPLAAFKVRGGATYLERLRRAPPPGARAGQARPRQPRPPPPLSPPRYRQPFFFLFPPRT